MDDDVFSIFFVGGRERERKWGQKTNFFLQDNGCVCDSKESINCASC